MKVLKDLTTWLVVCIMMIMVVYVLLLSADGEYEVNQERQKIHFDNIKESKYEK